MMQVINIPKKEGSSSNNKSIKLYDKKNQEKNIYEAFKLFDEDDSGALSRDEVRDMFNYICKQNKLPLARTADMQEVIDLQDQNGDNEIQLEELKLGLDKFMLMVSMPQKTRIEEILKANFRKYDKKRRGFVTKAIIRKIFDNLCWEVCVHNFSNEQLDKIIEKCGCKNYKITGIVDIKSIENNIESFYHLLMNEQKKITVSKNVKSFLQE